MLTMWFPLHELDEANKITAKITKNPPYITKWQRLAAADGRKGAKVYNIIYVDDSKNAEAGLYVAKLTSMYYDIEGFAWKMEPVMSIRDALKVPGVKIE